MWPEIWSKFHDHEISCFDFQVLTSVSWEAIQKLISSSYVRAVPELWISLQVHIRATKAFWEIGKTGSIGLVSFNRGFN